MLFPSRRSGVAAALVLLLALTNVRASNTSATTTFSTPTTAVQSTGTCEARTINYITDSLPQQCLRKEWNGFNHTGTGTGTVSVTEGAESTGTSSLADVTSVSIPSSTILESAEASATDLESGELGEGAFLSFEEWKKQTLEKAGQANANIGTKKPADGKKREAEGFQNNLDSLGDEGEIDLDFSSFRSGGKGEDAGHIADGGAAEVSETQELEKSGEKKGQRRSNDAGRTCKERFSYASFDAGATILKTHPGAKNSKAVLIENKDSYMLSECSTQNKFIIIELSEDIWIDTVVLANYEFFSSQIRSFRVSLSDRYPVKIDKWKDAGTYEARNSREIQAFLIANPQIWARYIRIEFLSHYGNEYYCPLSLVRVHGTRMLESWKETEANNEDDDGEAEGEEGFVPEAVAKEVEEEERLRAAAEELEKAAQLVQSCAENVQDLSAKPCVDGKVTPWIKTNLFEVESSNWLEDTCLLGEAPVAIPVATVSTASVTSSPTTTSISQASSSSSPSPTTKSASAVVVSPPLSSITESIVAALSNIAKEAISSAAVPSNSTSNSAHTSLTSTASASKSHNVSTTPKERSSTTSSATSALPTIQESFFKAVSRRLNFLETNSTLSLKYIEEQSRILREAFTKVEKKQLQKTTTFLDTLNSTVLDELRHFRQQYDEIWQSTVISLESQREESRREILAISSRLNILADEVVFQKRMSIVQSVLVLLCLGLVIFTHVSGSTPMDYTNMNNRMRFMSGMSMESPLESPPQSPEYVGNDPMQTARWQEEELDKQRMRQMNGATRDEYGNPRTPGSRYSENEYVEMTPPSGPDDVYLRTNAELPPLPAEEFDLHEQEQGQHMSLHPSTESLMESMYTMPEEIIVTPPEIPEQSPRRRSRNDLTDVSHQASPPTNIADHQQAADSASYPTPEPDTIPLLNFPDDSVPETNRLRNPTPKIEVVEVVETPPRLPSPPPEVPLQLSTNGSNIHTNGIGVAIPMSDSTKRHSILPDPQSPALNISSSPPVQSHSSRQSKSDETGYTSPRPIKTKRDSFSIARKPLPGLPTSEL